MITFTENRLLRRWQRVGTGKEMKAGDRRNGPGFPFDAALLIEIGLLQPRERHLAGAPVYGADELARLRIKSLRQSGSGSTRFVPVSTRRSSRPIEDRVAYQDDCASNGEQPPRRAARDARRELKPERSRPRTVDWRDRA